MDLLLAQAARIGADARPGQRSRRRPARRGDPAPRRRTGGGSRATRSAGCSPTTSSRHTDGRRSPGGHDAGVVVAAGRMAAAARRALRRDLHGLQVDRHGRARPPRVAVRVRLRAGARLPRGAPTAATRTASRPAVLMAEVAAVAGRRGRDVAGSPRATRRAVRQARHRRSLDATRPAEAAAAWRRCAPTRRPRSVAACHRCRVVRRGRPAAALAGRRPIADPPERHRAEGQALRRGDRADPSSLLTDLAALL